MRLTPEERLRRTKLYLDIITFMQSRLDGLYTKREIINHFQLTSRDQNTVLQKMIANHVLVSTDVMVPGSSARFYQIRPSLLALASSQPMLLR